MSTSRFNYSFYQDGRSDALAEVRLLQSQGLWTKEKRKSFLKDAISIYHRMKHTHPLIPEARSYYAGRIMALKSALTMKFSKIEQKRKETTDLIVYRPLAPHADFFCDRSGCWNKAQWGVSRHGDPQLFTLLCDPCRQEWERERSVYATPSGWDWHDDADLLLPLPKHRDLIQVKKEAIEFGGVALPCAFLLGIDLSNIFWPVDQLTHFVEMLAIVLVVWQGRNIARLLFFFESPEENP